MILSLVCVFSIVFLAALERAILQKCTKDLVATKLFASEVHEFHLQLGRGNFFLSNLSNFVV